MADDDQKHVEHQVQELEQYLEGLAHGGRIGHTAPDGRRVDNVEQEIARARREIEELRKRIAAEK